MTEREQFDAKELREAIFRRAGYRCEFCGEPVQRYGTPQTAHKIPQNTRNLIRYGMRIIHHPLNLAAACCLECNAALSIHNHPIEIAALVKRIEEATK